jgi:hypothetical protein
VQTSIFAFASDLHDEGIEAVLANVAERGGLDGINPAFVYHAARDVFPHNPRRKVRLTPDGAFFFRPTASLYEGLRIQPSVDELAHERDVLAETCRAAAARGLAVNAWTVFLHLDRPRDHAGCAPRNAFGDVYGTDLCPANPDARAYVRALTADVASHEVETILAESLHHHGLEHGAHHERYFVPLDARTRYLLGLCFCEHCLAEAAGGGVDASAVHAAVRSELAESLATGGEARELDREEIATIAGGELAGYLEARERTVTTLVEDAAEIAAACGKRLALLDLAGAMKGYATGRPAGEPAAAISWQLGLDLERCVPPGHELELLGYASEPDRLRLDVEAYRARVGERSLSVALRPTLPDCDSASNLAEKIRVARDAGMERIDFYHYGFMRLDALDWAREALAAVSAGRRHGQAAARPAET